MLVVLFASSASSNPKESIVSRHKEREKEMSVSGFEGQSAQAQAAAQAAPQSTGARPASSSFGLASAMSANTFLIGAGGVAGAVQLFMEAAKKLAPEQKDGYKIDFLPLTNADFPELYYAGVVVAVSLTDNAGAGVAYHTLILADTNSFPTPLTATVNNQAVEIIRVPGDAYDEDYRAAIAKVLQTTFKNVPGNRFFDADAEVVPEKFDYKNEAMVAVLIGNAVHAASTTLNSQLPDWNDLQLSRTINTTIQTALKFHQAPQGDAVGLPVRTDVRLVTSEVVNKQQPRPGERPSLNRGGGDKVVSGIGGFIDLLYAPEDTVLQQNPFLAGMQPQAPVSAKTYQPTFIISKLDAPLLSTLPGLLLNLAMLESLKEGNNWMGSLMPQPGVDFYVHDVGAIGLELPFSKDPATGQQVRINTRADSFKPQVLAYLVKAAFRDDLLIQMDVEETGPETWLKSVFLAAAANSPEANKAILSAADLLTNGAFGRHYQALGGGAPVISANNRILLGYYQDKETRQMKDIRELDYLAMLNLRENEPELLRIWSDTFTQSDADMDIRMHARTNIIKQVIGQFTPTGYARRVVLNPRLIRALAQAVAEVGLPVRLVTPYQDPAATMRGTANWMSQYALGGGNTGLFTRASVTPNQGFGSGFGGRWG